jgi:hypothetical protein
VGTRERKFNFLSVKSVSTLLLTGGPIGPPLFERPVAQKVMKFKIKIQKNKPFLGNYLTFEVVLRLFIKRRKL